MCHFYGAHDRCLVCWDIIGLVLINMFPQSGSAPPQIGAQHIIRDPVQQSFSGVFYWGKGLWLEFNVQGQQSIVEHRCLSFLVPA